MDIPFFLVNPNHNIQGRVGKKKGFISSESTKEVSGK